MSTLKPHRLRVRKPEHSPHVVPLSDAAIDILKSARAVTDGNWIFPTQQRRPLSDNALSKLLRDMGLQGRVTVHGFRSSFRTWAAETNACRNEVAEACLAHVDSNEVRRAYLRSWYLDERRDLMQRWADHVTSHCQ